MVESGDVDWANHANNLDSSIGAVFAGDEAFSISSLGSINATHGMNRW